MNRFLRTAFSVTIVYLVLALCAGLITGTAMPFPAFSLLYFGLLIFLLPGVLPKLKGKEFLFQGLGAAAALLGFLPLLLLRCPALHLAVHLLGIAAAGAFLPILRHRTTHDRFLAKYQFTAAALLLVMGLICLSMMTGVYAEEESSARIGLMKLAINSMVPYVTVLLATGVLLLRGLRAAVGTVDEQTFNRRQLRDTLIFALLVSVVFAADPFVWLQKAAYFLINDVLKPSGRFLLSVAAAILRLLSVWRPGEEPEPQPTEETSELRPVPSGENAGADPVPEHYDIDGEELSRVIACIFAGVLMLILLWILVRQVRKLIRNLRERALKYGSGYPREIRETVPQEEISEKKRAGKRSAEPRERMRYLYGEYLRYLKKRKVGRDETETCGEIRIHAENSSVSDPPTLREFTELYEQARYQMEETPGESDARRMKELFDRIRKK